ncbi:proline iminopeptidase [Motilibacter peucedani]|uniref:Proline iminopeptidase n=1 Tax=Motilibacter peucedani TaxID=598650 RepID=A0A420XS34_9ACTN|nr:prolyl aminopeptidase [Motilibacter peucedani]RKS77607.1 proline iminopeptidase [Motilibacter peucedani]
MSAYAVAAPTARGVLDVGDGHRVSWTVSGSATGWPAVLLHGGPGSGSSESWRSFLDPDRYRIVQFDQRGSGSSTPSAGDASTDLSTNTTSHLIGDIERLRSHLGVDRWLVLGGSWGSTLALAYAQAHPERVSELVLFAVATTTRREVEWVTREMGRVFPREWERFRDVVPAGRRDGDLSAAYAELLASPDPVVRERAAAEWCRWEDTHVSLVPGYRHDARYDDPAFRMRFARLVTHYWSHAAFLPDGGLEDGMAALTDVPGVLVHGRLDVSSPLDSAWRLHTRWPGSELVVLDSDGHGGPGFAAALAAATDRLADRREDHPSEGRAERRVR